MNLRMIVVPLAVAASAFAQSAPAAKPAGPGKVAIIAFQAAVLSTQEGQQAQAAMKSKFDPRKTQLEKRQADLKAMQDRLQTGGAGLTPDARTKLQNDISSGTRALNNDAEDLNNDVQEEQGKVLQAMAGKMGDILKKYAAENGYTVVLDVSSQQTPVLWASPGVNITADIVKLYDQAHPAASAGAAKTPAPAPTAAPKPPASKKQ